MIYCLQGKLLKKSPEVVVISCGGVGYQVQVPSGTLGMLPAIGQEATLYTYMNISENDISLYGFADEEQKECFQMLIGVSGVGPKAGLAILSVLSPGRVAVAISAEDYKAFTAASGVGPKLAKRITLELKDKVGRGLAEGGGLSSTGGGTAAPAAATTTAIAALVSLGYTQGEAATAVARIDETLPAEEIIKLALAQLARRR